MRFGFGLVFVMCDCEQAINDALAHGHDGRAEYLAARCDREHGDTTPTTAVSELRDIKATTTPANATAAAGTENDEREAS